MRLRNIVWILEYRTKGAKGPWTAYAFDSSSKRLQEQVVMTNRNNWRMRRFDHDTRTPTEPTKEK
jgi:hypothetical protein